MNNGSPLGAKKTVRLMVAMTLLVWATQTLMHQWGFGATPPVATEKFVPQAGMGFGSTLELRSEARVQGAEVKFRQVFRWAQGDDAVFAPLGDLVLAKLPESAAFASFGLADFQKALAGAQVNQGMIRFAGATDCRVSRCDVDFSERVALEQWLEAKAVTGVADKLEEAPAAMPVVKQIVETPRLAAELSTPKPETLREQIVTDLAERLKLPADSFQLAFDPKDARLLDLAGPTFRFYLTAKRARDLGTISYDVTIATNSGTQRVTLTGEARAWQTQILSARSIAYKQVIRDEDLTDRKALVDQLSSQPVLARAQIVGQQAARDIQPAVLMTGNLIDAVPLVKNGQLVTVQLNQGSVQLTTVARAMENGAYGQTIKVKNELSRDVFEVVVTGAQAGSMGATNLASAR